MIEAPGHLEKALIKVWYRERSEAFFAQQDLLEEVITDFILFLQSGDLHIGDPATKTATALHRAKWPQVIKAVPAYCESPWKKSEHHAVCLDKDEAIVKLEEQVPETSLRPLLVSSWIRAYQSLNTKERFFFVQNLAQLLRSENTPVLPLTKNHEDIGVSGDALVKAAAAIKNLNAFVSTSRAMNDSEIHRLFVSSLTNELRVSGFQEAFVEAYFDVLYVSQNSLSDKSSVFQQFLKIAKENPKLQIALQDQENLWMLPAKHPVFLRSFGNLKAHRTVVEKCGEYNFNYVIEYSQKTEKLLVVDHCDARKEVHYSQFLKDGTIGFAAQNKTVTFVQFHLPSLLMKKNDLATVPNVLEFIQKRDVDSVPFKSLGWREVHWSQPASAYQPVAPVDAIEWFRVIN